MKKIISAFLIMQILIVSLYVFLYKKENTSHIDWVKQEIENKANQIEIHKVHYNDFMPYYLLSKEILNLSEQILSEENNVSVGIDLFNNIQSDSLLYSKNILKVPESSFRHTITAQSNEFEILSTTLCLLNRVIDCFSANLYTFSDLDVVVTPKDKSKIGYFHNVRIILSAHENDDYVYPFIIGDNWDSINNELLGNIDTIYAPDGVGDYSYKIRDSISASKYFLFVARNRIGEPVYYCTQYNALK